MSTKTYSARGSIHMEGVTFFIPARSLAEAKQLAASGHYNDYNVGLGTIEEYSINQDTVELDQ